MYSGTELKNADVAVSQSPFTSVVRTFRDGQIARKVGLCAAREEKTVFIVVDDPRRSIGALDAREAGRFSQPQDAS